MYALEIHHEVVSEKCADPRQWRWTKRLAILVATVPVMLQLLIGVFAELTLPPPPPGFASTGLAIMLGSIITAGLFAFVGAAVGCLIDVVISVPGREKRNTLPTHH